MKPDHFSIIMPAFNASATIGQSIESVLAQTCPSWTLYVIDDASSDNTREVVETYARQERRLVYHQMPLNGGVAAARNQGIAMADGEYVAFLDSDDIWHPQKLETQRHYLLNGYDVVCSDYFIFSGEIANIVGKCQRKENFTYRDMLKSNNIGNLTGAYNRYKLGSFTQQRIGHEDYVMWLEIMANAKRGYCVKQSLAYYRRTEGSLSSNKLKAASWQWHIYRKILKLPLLPALYYWLHYAFTAISMLINNKIKGVRFD
ncbi:glycosyltransferase family 2 protein [Aeromonas sp. sif2416]|uniref:glycosyltransferase family 2 protein n=1 Tax=Aeromonas sp. sif2416 TaxID=2854793 RepID=UPI001C442A9D|nr:glycosyltransferase family 2 protein [Aeromonas sp. sif2416]MBV7438480.1 glycosyltransferase family 2 protein [Aeromonas sp. sif2416]